MSEQEFNGNIPLCTAQSRKHDTCSNINIFPFIDTGYIFRIN